MRRGDELPAEDTRRIMESMRSGERLRTQWIGRAAFGLGRDGWRPEHARRVLGVLRPLVAHGLIERRDGFERKSALILGRGLPFVIPRDEWRRALTPSVSEARSVEGAALAIVVERLPNPMTCAQLCEWMTTVIGVEASPIRVGSIRRAVADLLAVGLLTYGDGGVLTATPAARRAAELDLGL